MWFQNWNGRVSHAIHHRHSHKTPPFQHCTHEQLGLETLKQSSVCPSVAHCEGASVQMCMMSYECGWEWEMLNVAMSYVVVNNHFHFGRTDGMSQS